MGDNKYRKRIITANTESNASEGPIVEISENIGNVKIFSPNQKDQEDTLPQFDNTNSELTNSNKGNSTAPNTNSTFIEEFTQTLDTAIDVYDINPSDTQKTDLNIHTNFGAKVDTLLGILNSDSKDSSLENSKRKDSNASSSNNYDKTSSLLVNEVNISPSKLNEQTGKQRKRSKLAKTNFENAKDSGSFTNQKISSPHEDSHINNRNVTIVRAINLLFPSSSPDLSQKGDEKYSKNISESNEGSLLRYKHGEFHRTVNNKSKELPKPQKIVRDDSPAEKHSQKDFQDFDVSEGKVIETRPQYLKLFSILKEAARNRTVLKRPYTDRLLPDNLNNDERITLSMISHAIKEGLDSLSKSSKTNGSETNEDDDDRIEFIYIGLSPTPLNVNNSNIVFLNPDGKPATKTSKQVERTRRNTNSHKDQIMTESKGKPVFFIPWKKSDKAETKSAEPNLKDSESETQSSSIVEVSTEAEIPTTAQPTIKSRLQRVVASPVQIAENSEVRTKKNVSNSRLDALTARRSRSRMTIPGIRLLRLRKPKNATQMTNFTKTKYEQYKSRKNLQALPGRLSASITTNIADENSSATESLRLIGRKVQSEIISTSTPPESELENKQKVERIDRRKGSRGLTPAGRLRRLRGRRRRLLRRRGESEKIEDSSTTTEEPTTLLETKRNRKDASTTITPSISKIELISKENRLKSKETDKKAAKEVATEKYEALKSEEKVSLRNVKKTAKLDDSDNEITALTELLKSSPKRDKSMRLSARLRLRNRNNSQKRARNRQSEKTKPESPANDKAQSEQALEEAQIRSSLEVVPDISEIDSNTIEDSTKVATSSEATATKVTTSNSRRNGKKSFLTQRARLLDLIRARVEARKALKQSKTQQDKVRESTAAPVIATKKAVEIKNVDAFVIPVKPKIKITPSKAIRQRLLPTVVQTTEASILPVPTLAPVNVTQSQQFYESLRHSTTKKTTTFAPQTVKYSKVRQPEIILKPKLVNNRQKTQSTGKNIKLPQRPQSRQQNLFNNKPLVLHPPVVHKVYHPIPVTHTPITEPSTHRSTHSTQTPQPVVHPHPNVLTNPHAYQPINQLVHRATTAPPIIHHPHYTPTIARNLHQRIDPNNKILHNSHQPVLPQSPKVPATNNKHHHNIPVAKKEERKTEFDSLLPTEEDFPEINFEFEPPTFEFPEEFNYKEPQFVIDYKKKEKENYKKPQESIRSVQTEKQKIPEGAKVTEKEYFIEGPSGVPIKVTTVTFHTSKSSIRNENVKNRSSQFKRDPFKLRK